MPCLRGYATVSVWMDWSYSCNFVILSGCGFLGTLGV